MSAIRQDVGYALRLLKRSPGYAAIAIGTLAIGIGANTAMFAVVNAILLKPLPFANQDRLMLMHRLSPNRDGGFRQTSWSYPDTGRSSKCRGYSKTPRRSPHARSA